MEHDRFQHNSKLFVLGIITLLLSLTFFALGFYLLPYLLWGWDYQVPGFILVWQEWLKEEYGFTDSSTSWLIFFVFIIPALICGFISHLVSNHIDNEIYGLTAAKTEKHTEMKEEVKASLSLGFKIFMLIILILLALSLLQWLLSVPAPQ